ncbi:hypothetical protein P4V41_07280 [Fictibacillus nanhaiensis]|uniref:hypothetical protein n=1 Tax=Fictibacillus nanhaiensis TaxID=742169 RepID=UPI002E1FA5DB|nr:hypothetical protein [Fictibacillus nanhaiensis]
MSRKIRPISFNLDDPHEYQMYEESMKLPNFSGYVKRLLLQSLLNEQQPVYNQPTKPVNNLSSKQQINQEYLSNLI